MFHTIVTLSYTIPAIYLFIRLWQLFIEKRYRLYYLAVYFILFSIYPLSGLLEGRDSWLVRLAEAFSGYLISFFLYLFLAVILIDVALLLNLLLRLIPLETLRNRQFRNRLFLVIISFSATVVVAGIVNFNTIRTTVHSISIPRRSSGIDELKIAFVSDFHLEEKTPVRFVERFVRKIGIINPDLVLFGGDITEGGRLGPHMVEIEGILNMMDPPSGVYGVLGNHDGSGRGNVRSFLKNSGIKILQDTIVVVGSSFAIAGRNDSRMRERPGAADLVARAPDSLPLIILDHRPTEPEQLSNTRADISLSGHTHNGQLFPVNFITRRVYELSYGHKKKGNTHFFVSSGIRLWGPHVRTTGKSEILVVEVTFE